MRIRKSRYLALEDVFDSRIPLRSEEEFRVGIVFAAKLVGSGNVARPSSRMEIVASMRRIRSECKSRKDKKNKVDITVSYEGVRVSLAAGKKSNSAIAFSHPIHRIFYVSHDSLDLHVFSYIAREGSIFKCFVFKAAKQSLAINIVRTIGQAFELCHKMTRAMNETAINSSVVCSSAVEQLNVNPVPVAVKESDAVSTNCRLEKYDASLVNSLSQGFNTDMRMLQRVDSKLDKLADKVELLEKQITILLKNIEIKNPDHNDSSGESSGKSSCHDINETSKAKLLNDLKYLDQSSVDKLESKSEKLSYLLSPDSLLSSPILHPTNTGSCLLFNDLY